MTPLPAWRDEVLAVYEWADNQVSLLSPTCTVSGRCCRFPEFGHTLFISQMEARILLDGAPFQPSAESRQDDSGCPFQLKGRCEARQARPLGCRVFFCDPAFAEAMPGIMEKGISMIKAVADRHGLDWCYAPLHHFLDGRYAASLDLPESGSHHPCEPSSSRFVLPLA